MLFENTLVRTSKILLGPSFTTMPPPCTTEMSFQRQFIAKGRFLRSNYKIKSIKKQKQKQTNNNNNKNPPHFLNGPWCAFGENFVPRILFRYWSPPLGLRKQRYASLRNPEQMCHTLIFPALCIPEHQLSIRQSTGCDDRRRAIGNPDKKYGSPSDAFGQVMSTLGP